MVVCFDVDTFDALTAEAKTRGISRAELIRQAVAWERDNGCIQA